METYNRILESAAELFANQGFEAVSMRDIAKASHLKAPSLYNHFRDKNALYQSCLKFVFRQHNAQLQAVFDSQVSYETQLRGVIQVSLKRMADDQNFRLLIQRELLQNDQQRLKFLAQEVMADTCDQLEKILKHLSPEADHHFIITSIMSLVLFHIQIAPMREFLPSGTSQHLDIHYLSDQIFQLIYQTLLPS